MAQFPGMNEKAFQTIAMADGQSLTGSNVFTATTTTGVGCSDGTVQPHFRSTIITSPITLTEIYNGSADKVTGWNLGAKGASVITEANTYGTSSSGRFPNYATICADHGSVTNPFATFGQSHSDVTSFKFNGTAVSSWSTRTWPRPSDPAPPPASPPTSRVRGVYCNLAPAARASELARREPLGPAARTRRHARQRCLGTSPLRPMARRVQVLEHRTYDLMRCRWAAYRNRALDPCVSSTPASTQR